MDSYLNRIVQVADWGASPTPYTVSIPQMLKPVKVKKEIFKLVLKTLELVGLVAFAVALIALLIRGGI